jgi:hypothetical protein
MGEGIEGVNIARITRGRPANTTEWPASTMARTAAAGSFVAQT